MAGSKRRSVNIKKKKIICLQCKTQVLESDGSFECDSCNKTLHSQCTQLNKVEIEKLLSDDSLEYKCHFCEPVNDNKSELNVILREMREMKETMNFMSTQYDAILNGVKKNTTTIKQLQNENKVLREDVKQLKSTVSFLNNIRVQNDCIINGIQTDATAKAVDVVLGIAKTTGANICEGEIEDAYFVNRRKQSTNSSVIVKFNNKKSKAEFMKEKKKLRESNETKTVYINDLLSKDNLDLLHHAKTLKAVGFKYIYAQNGHILVKKDGGVKATRIRSMDDIDDILMKAASGENRHSARPGVVRQLSDKDDDDDEEEGFVSPN